MDAGRLALLALLAALALAVRLSEAQQLYRWVDDQGAVHYTDQVPPTQADKERARLSEHGITVETQPAAPTAEERERARELERERAEQAQRQAERQVEDTRLLQHYRTVEELELARDGHLAATEAHIQAKRDQMRDETRTLIAVYEERRALQADDQTVPLELMNKIEVSLTNLRIGYAAIVEDEYRKESIKDEFADTIARFRQLKRLPASDDAPDGAARSPRNGTNLVRCRDRARCHAYWERAVDYVRAQADPKSEVLGPGLLIAFQHDEREVRTLILAWVQTDADQPVEIYLDIQCRNRLTASLVCLDPNVPRIRAGFSSAVMDE